MGNRKKKRVVLGWDEMINNSLRVKVSTTFSVAGSPNHEHCGMKSDFRAGAYMKKIILAATVAVSLLISAGCHTVHGMGQDIQSAGHAIERATGK